MNFGRLITAMLTPFASDGTIDWGSLERCIDRLVTTGSDAIVVAGTTAESPNLSHEEKLKLFEFTLQKVAGRVGVIAGTGSNNTLDSIALTKEAEEIGVDGVMLVAPYYNKPSQEGIYQHFSAIVESTSLPVMIYNIPGRTGVNISVETMVRLAHLDNIISFKEASGDLNQVSRLISKVPSEIAVYSGDDSLTLPVLSVGGAGVVSVAGHIVGEEIKEMIKSYMAGDTGKAALMHKKLLPIFDGLFISSNPVPLKYVMARKGFCEPFVRRPLVEMNDEEKRVTNLWADEILKVCT